MMMDVEKEINEGSESSEEDKKSCSCDTNNSAEQGLTS